MNLLIGFVILLCLVCSEIQAAEVATDLWTRIIFVALISLSVPGLALFQTLVVSRRIRETDLKLRQHESLLNRLSVCHSAVWLTASLAIVWAVRWQDVVRGNWNFDRWPLLDEAVILAPVVLSLVASWAVFYEIQYAIKKADAKTVERRNWHSRLAFVSIRFRVYFLMILIPVGIAILARDLSPITSTMNPSLKTATLALALLGMAAGFPFLLLLIWKNRPIKDQSLKDELMNTCTINRLHVHDVRIWKTNGQIVNALVAGVIPKFRIILVSDSLINYFPKHELLAVIRHEAGHLRLWHLPTRIGFAVLPLLAFAIDERNPNGIIASLGSLFVDLGMPFEAGLAVLLMAYILYAVFGLSWFSKKMEFEADLYACQDHSQFKADNQNAIPFNNEHSSAMSDALLRLAAFAPDQIEKSSLLHPSLGDRMRLIQKFESDPVLVMQFKRSFARRRTIVFVSLVVFCLTVCAI